MRVEPGNGGYVTWGRYDAEHQEIVRRLGNLEQATSRLSSNEIVHQEFARRIETLEIIAERMRVDEADTAALKDRVDDLEAFHVSSVEGDKARRDRIWTIVFLVVGSLILPLLVSSVLMFLHIHVYH